MTSTRTTSSRTGRKSGTSVVSQMAVTRSYGLGPKREVGRVGHQESRNLGRRLRAAGRPKINTQYFEPEFGQEAEVVTRPTPDIYRHTGAVAD